MADYYWHGRANDGLWSNGRNWGIGSVIDQTNTVSPPSLTATRVYINNGSYNPATSGFSNTALIYYDITVDINLSSLIVNPAQALTLSIINGTTNKIRTVNLYGNFLINSLVNLLEFSIPNITFPIQKSSQFQYIDVNGWHQNTNPTGNTLTCNVIIVGTSVQLLSNLTLSSFNYFRIDTWYQTPSSGYYYAYLHLNGFGVTAGNMALGTVRNTSTANLYYVYIVFYKNGINYSFLEVTGYDGQTAVPGGRTFQTSSNNYLINRFVNYLGSSLTPPVTSGFAANQQPIIIVSGTGDDGYVPTPGATDSNGLSRTIYTYRQNTDTPQSPIATTTRSFMATVSDLDIADIYVVGGAFASNNYSSNNIILNTATTVVPAPGLANNVYTKFYNPTGSVNDSGLIGNFDCSGASIGLLTTGDGCRHPVSFMASAGISQNYLYANTNGTSNGRGFIFTKNIIFPTAITSNYSASVPMLITDFKLFPSFYLVQRSSGQPTNVQFAIDFYTGWVIDFKGADFAAYYYGGVSSTSPNGNSYTPMSMLIATESAVNLFFISNIRLHRLYVYCDNSDDSMIFLCPGVLLTYSRDVTLSRGMISTVYGGQMASIQALEPNNPIWSKVSTTYITTSQGSFQPVMFTMAGGVLDLYTAGDLKQSGIAWAGSYNSSAFYVTSTVQTARINFNFLVDRGRSYSDGMIQTESCDLGSYCYIGIYSSLGNIVTAASDTAVGIPPQVAISVGSCGYSQYSTSPYGYIKYTNGTNMRSLDAIIWQDSVLNLTGLRTPDGTALAYQLTADSLVVSDQSYNDWNFWQQGGPLVAKIIQKNNRPTAYATTYKAVLTTSSNVFFVIGDQGAITTPRIVFTSYNYPTVKIAGLDTKLASNKVQLYSGVSTSYASGQLEITNSAGGHFFSGSPLDVSYSGITSLTFTGGSPSAPAQIDIPSAGNSYFPLSSIAITAPGYVYLVGTTNISATTVYVQSGTVDQSLNTSATAPTVKSVDFDTLASGARTFVHGSIDGNATVAFNIAQNNGLAWASSYHTNSAPLRITTLSNGVRFAPGIINFTGPGTLAATLLDVCPGNHNGYTYGVEATTTFVTGNLGIDTPDQNALIFQFADNPMPLNAGTLTFTSYDANTVYPMCVQTLILGKYTAAGAWQGWIGGLTFTGDMIFCGTDINGGVPGYRSPSFETFSHMYYGGSLGTQYGGLIAYNGSYLTANNPLGRAITLFFQGSGEINLNTTSPQVIISVGTSTYQYVMQVNQPGLPDTVLPDNFNSFTAYNYRSYQAGPYTSRYSIFGSYNQLNLMGGLIEFSSTPTYISNPVDYTVRVTNLTIRDTIGAQTYGGYVAVSLYSALINLGGAGVTYPLNMYPQTTSTYFYGSGALRFYDGSIFNAFLDDYSNIAIGTFKNSNTDPTPTITINPCTDFSGVSPSTAQFGDLVSSGQGPSIFKFTSNSTSIFQKFTYNDTAAPLVNGFYSYSNTLSNTVLKSTQPGYQFNISVPTPHLGTIKSGVSVNNMTIQNSAALNPYIWFAPGTVNRYANTGTSFLPGRSVKGNYYTGTNVSYYNFDAGNNTGWIFNQAPNSGMDQVFWDNPPFNWNTNTNAAGVLNRFTHTFYTQSIY